MCTVRTRQGTSALVLPGYQGHARSQNLDLNYNTLGTVLLYFLFRSMITTMIRITEMRLLLRLSSSVYSDGSK